MSGVSSMTAGRVRGELDMRALEDVLTCGSDDRQRAPLASPVFPAYQRQVRPTLPSTPLIVLRFEADNAAAMTRIQREFRDVLTHALPGVALPF